MADEVVRISGLDDARKQLNDLPRKLRFGALRRGLRSAGNVIRAQARINAPVLKRPTPRRIAGLVRRSIVVRGSRLAKQRGDVGVFVTVFRSKPARQLGSFSDVKTKRVTRPNDPFYFKFLELGTKKMQARSFIGPALDQKSTQATDAFSGELRRAIVVANSRR